MRINSIIPLSSVIFIFVIAGCTSQTNKSLSDNNLQIISLYWNEQIDCDICNRRSESCEPLNAAILKIKLDYFQPVHCNVIVDGNALICDSIVDGIQGKSECNYEYEVGISQHEIPMNMKESHSLSTCCQGICKSASIPPKCV